MRRVRPSSKTLMTRTLTRARPLDRLFRTGPGPRARSLASGHVDLGGAFVSAEVEDASTVITNARVRMPRMIYGTAWKKERTKELVLLAVRQGFRGIDTACQPKHYREDLVGDALAQLYAEGTVRREDLFLQTKFTLPGGHDERAPYDLDASRQERAKGAFNPCGRIDFSRIAQKTINLSRQSCLQAESNHLKSHHENMSKHTNRCQHPC